MKIACIVLAAGGSSRFGQADKLLVEVDGKPLIWHAVSCAQKSRCAEVHVVIRPGSDRLERALAGLPIEIRTNPCHTHGIGSSISLGIAGLASDIDGALILPADMPFMQTSLLDALITRFERDGGGSIVYPTTINGEQRNPVLWPRTEFHHLGSLDADHGARALISSLPTAKIAVKADDDGIFRDIDTPDDLPG